MPSLCGALCGALLLSLMSCGHYAVDHIDVSWKDDIERDKREIMSPPNPKIVRPKNYCNQWCDEYLASK